MREFYKFHRHKDVIREFHSVIMERRMGVQFYLLDAEQQRDTTATGATSAKVASGGFFRIGSDRFYRTYLRFCLEGFCAMMYFSKNIFFI